MRSNIRFQHNVSGEQGAGGSTNTKVSFLLRTGTLANEFNSAGLAGKGFSPGCPSLSTALHPDEALSRLLEQHGGPDGHLGDGHRAAGRPAAFTRSCPCGFTESQCCIHDTSTFQPICRGPDRSQPAQGQLRGHPSPGSLDPGTQNAFPDFLKGNLKPQGSGLS